MRNRPLHPPVRRAGFTLLEIIIVVTIIAIMATLTVPRLTGLSRREFALAGDRVSDLLMMYAQRDATMTRPVGIALNPDRQALELLIYTENGNGEADWFVDRYVDPVLLGGVVDLENLRVFADGESVNIVQYPLTHAPGTERPDIEIVLQSADGTQSTVLLLPPHALVPMRGEAGASVVELRRPVDLDEQGRSREDW